MATPPSTSPTQPARGADIRAMIEQVTRLLVDAPDEVEVEDFDERGTTIYELFVAPDDLGIVIGKGGRTAKALRSLVEAAAEKAGGRATLDIVDVDEEDDLDAADGDEAVDNIGNTADAGPNGNVNDRAGNGPPRGPRE